MASKEEDVLWLRGEDGRPLGPYYDCEIRDRLQLRRISQDALANRDRSDRWQPLGDLLSPGGVKEPIVEPAVPEVDSDCKELLGRGCLSLRIGYYVLSLSVLIAIGTLFHTSSSDSVWYDADLYMDVYLYSILLIFPVVFLVRYFPRFAGLMLLLSAIHYVLWGLAITFESDAYLLGPLLLVVPILLSIPLGFIGIGRVIVAQGQMRNRPVTKEVVAKRISFESLWLLLSLGGAFFLGLIVFKPYYIESLLEFLKSGVQDSGDLTAILFLFLPYALSRSAYTLWRLAQSPPRQSSLPYDSTPPNPQQ